MTSETISGRPPEWVSTPCSSLATLRSLRLREDDPSLRDVVPAGVISELSQLLAVLQLAGEREPRINDRRSAHG